MLSRLQRIPPHEVLGIDEALLANLDEDGENEILFQRSRDRSVDEILAMLIESKMRRSAWTVMPC